MAALFLAVRGGPAAIGVAFVTAGLPLIGAAAFYGRIREFGPHGVKTDPLQAFAELPGRLPPTDDPAAEAERTGLLEAIEAILSASSRSGEAEGDAEPGELADLGATAYERGSRLQLAARAWIAGEGYDLLQVEFAGVDFVVRRSGEVAAIEVRSVLGPAGAPTPEALRDGFLKARIWADERLGVEGAFHRLLLIDMPVLPAELAARYRRDGIGVICLDPDGRGEMVIPPRDSRL